MQANEGQQCGVHEWEDAEGARIQICQPIDRTLRKLIVRLLGVVWIGWHALVGEQRRGLDQRAREFEKPYGFERAKSVFDESPAMIHEELGVPTVSDLSRVD